MTRPSFGRSGQMPHGRRAVSGDSLQPSSVVRPETGGGIDDVTASVLGVVVATVYLFSVMQSLNSGYDIWGGVVVAPFLFVATLPGLRRLLRRVEPDESIRRIVLLAFGAKLLSAYGRFYANEFFLGRGDAFVYHRYATDVSAEFREFTFGGPAYDAAITDVVGTEFIRLLLSGVYTISGPTRLGGFVIFSFMSFWGLYLFYRAFSIAVPDGARRRYAFLVFFMPSMLFWPSSVGKEAWMTTMLGLGVYGLARLLADLRFAYLPILAALAGLGIVRPHVGAIFLCGLAVAVVLRRTSRPAKTTRKIVGVAILLIAAGLLMAQLQSFFGFDEGFDAAEVFERTSERSGQGGSRFESTQPTNIGGLPWAIVTVLFRPFPHEAGSVAGFVTSIEAVFLAGAFLVNVRRLGGLASLAITRPYVGFVTAYSLVFVFAFSAVSNFGILARQRTQLIPIVLVLLAVPVETRLRRRVQTDRDENAARSPLGPRFISGAPPAPMT